MDEALDFDNNLEILTTIVNRGELPRFLYKYASIASLKLILETSSIKFSKPSEFNDPFDCNLIIDTNNTEEEIEGDINFLQKKSNLAAEQVNKLRHKFHDPIELHNITNKSVKEAKENFGLSCFSRLNNSLVMWAHYADNYKGVCLKFDILADTDFCNQ